MSLYNTGARENQYYIQKASNKESDLAKLSTNCITSFGIMNSTTVHLEKKINYKTKQTAHTQINLIKYHSKITQNSSHSLNVI